MMPPEDLKNKMRTSKEWDSEKGMWEGKLDFCAIIILLFHVHALLYKNSYILSLNKYIF